MYDPKVRLKTLAALVDFCQGHKGGELASAVHAYGKTGDPQMRALVQHILSLVSNPILNFLYRWIYDGELEDTYHEVFVHSIDCVLRYSRTNILKNSHNHPKPQRSKLNKETEGPMEEKVIKGLLLTFSSTTLTFDPNEKNH